MRARFRRHWIPPLALGAGQLAHGASWVLLFLLAQNGMPFGFPALSWLHLVALGWLTLTALAVLVHVIPAFTDAPWKAESTARGALLFYALGVALLAVAFWMHAAALLPWTGSLVAIALAAYLVPAGSTLAAAYAGPRVEAAIARALTITLGALFVTVALGVALAFALAGRAPVSLLARVPPIHAAFGLIGWLTILIMGVSARTIRPIAGTGSRYPRAHIVAGTFEAAGLIILSAGAIIAVPVVTLCGAIVLLAGALAYAADVADVLRRATVKHRPPQAFFAAGSAWLVFALALVVGTIAGAPWGPVAAYVMLIGWAGQLLNAHIHHIGVRLIATIARGDDDETRPGELLAAPLSWTAFGLFQCAVAAGTVAILVHLPWLLGAAAVAGAGGWLTLAANLVVATNRAQQPLPPPDSRMTISLV